MTYAKNQQFYYDPLLFPPAKMNIDLLFKNKRIHKRVTNFKIPPPPAPFPFPCGRHKGMALTN